MSRALKFFRYIFLLFLVLAKKVFYLESTAHSILASKYGNCVLRLLLGRCLYIYIFVVSTLIDQIGAPVNNTQQAFSKNYFTQTTTKKVKIQWRQFFVVFNRFQVFAIRSYVFFSFCLFYKKLLFNQLHNVYREKTSGDFMRFWICLILNGAGFFDFVNHCVSLLWMKLVKSYLVHNRLIISHSVFCLSVSLSIVSFRLIWSFALRTC